MKEITIALVLFLLLSLGISWAVQGNDFFMYKVFAPKYEAARRQTFEQSKAYNEGMAQELSSAALSYARAGTREQRQAICSYALHTAADADRNRLSGDVVEFLSKCQTEVVR